jgi:putative FmdB family regulatory protein
MPLFEYKCENADCGLVFERLVRDGQQKDTHECPCGSQGQRSEASKFGFSVDGPGFRKTDHASFDERVGQDAEKRWEYYKTRQAKKRQLQESNPGKRVEVSSTDHSYVVVDP